MSFKITSLEFEHNGNIPALFTCDGANINPELNWKDAPSSTQSFALIVDDPDAPMGTWDHWILFNIPANINKINKELLELPKGTKVGKNSWGEDKYGGPCPPDGEHRYFFKLYALDCILDLNDGTTKKELEEAMHSHILAKAELMGKYDRIERVQNNK